MSDIRYFEINIIDAARTLFIGNQFDLPIDTQLHEVVGLINLQPNVILSIITVGGAMLGNSTYIDLQKPIMRSGLPLT